MRGINNQKKKITLIFRGILIISALLFVYSSIYYIDVQKTIRTVEVEIKETNITMIDNKVASTSLAFVISNPSEHLAIQVRNFRAKILSLNGNITDYLVKEVYPQIGEQITIAPKETLSLTVEFPEVYITDQPILQWAFTHDKWYWEIYLRIIMDIGYSQIGLVDNYLFEGTIITGGKITELKSYIFSV